MNLTSLRADGIVFTVYFKPGYAEATVEFVPDADGILEEGGERISIEIQEESTLNLDGSTYNLDASQAAATLSIMDNPPPSDADIDLWYERNLRKAGDDLTERLFAIIEIHENGYLAPKESNGWVVQEGIEYAFAWLPFKGAVARGVRQTAEWAVSYTSENLADLSGGDYLKFQREVAERWKDEIVVELGKVRDRLKTDGPEQLPRDITVHSKEDYLADILQTWWSANATIDLSHNPGLGGMPRVNIIAGSADPEKVMRAIWAVDGSWHFYDGAKITIEGREELFDVATVHEVLRRYEAAAFGR